MNTDPTGARTRAGAIDVVLVACIVALAFWLRLPLLDLGYTSDEVGTVTTASFWQILQSAETGVNPPLWRWMFDLPFGPWEAPWWGRRFSLVMSLAAVCLGYAVARQASGSRLAAVGAALLLAGHPWSVRYGAIFRVYAWWSAWMLLHVLAMGRALDATGRRRIVWGAVAVGTAVVAPWIHYFSVPVLLVLGGAVVLGMPGQRRWVLAYLPSALGVLPLVSYVLFEEGNRVSPDREPLGRVFVHLGSLNLHPPSMAFRVLGRAYNAWFGTWPPMGELMLGTTLGLIGVGMVGWGRASATLRLLVAGLAGVLGGSMVLAQVQYVRSATLVMVVAFAAPALLSVPTLARTRWASVVGVLVVGVWYLARLPASLEEDRPGWEVEQAIPWLVAHRADFDAVRGGRPFIVAPSHRVWTMFFHLGHDEPRAARRGPGCADWNPCFTWEGVDWPGVDAVGDGHLLDGLVLWVDPQRPEGVLSTCEVLHDAGSWAIHDCRGGGNRTDPDRGGGG